MSASLRRRADAALRLPPLECGCQDPDARSHLECHDDAAPRPASGGGCWYCASLGLDQLRYLASLPDPRCPCAKRDGVEVGAA